MKKVLALDLGTVTGWCYSKTGSNSDIESGIKRFTKAKSENYGQRFHKFRNFLIETKNTKGVDFVFYEAVTFTHKSLSSAHVYGAFLGVLTQWCEESNIGYEGLHVGKIKKHVTGSGRAKKAAVLDIARAFKPGLHNHNEADSIAIMLLGLDMIKENEV